MTLEVEMEKGLQTSMWTRLKECADLLLSKEKGSLFCLAKGQIVQFLVQQFWRKGKTWL